MGAADTGELATAAGGGEEAALRARMEDQEDLLERLRAELAAGETARAAAAAAHAAAATMAAAAAAEADQRQQQLEAELAACPSSQQVRVVPLCRSSSLWLSLDCPHLRAPELCAGTVRRDGRVGCWGQQVEELQRRVAVLQAVVGPTEEEEGAGSGGARATRQGGEAGSAAGAGSTPTAALQEHARRLAAEATTCKRQLLERDAALDEARRRNADLEVRSHPGSITCRHR